jgi:DNA-binding IclR family transcriptional regulator
VHYSPARRLPQRPGGAAILDHTGHPVAAISAAGPAERMERSLARIAPIVASTAEAISRRLGYAPR